ncbi:MAG: FliM/FliN family flagellar motor C-terminal domain-containing protein [Acidobacteriaceae bacterium]
MAGNIDIDIRMLELWIEAVCVELRELLGVPVTARAAGDIPQAAGACRTMLLIEGSAPGVAYLTISSAGMVQFAQMAAGDEVDAHAPWTSEMLEAWRRLLDAAGTRLAARLMEESAQDASPGRSTILLAETIAIDGMHPADEAETGTAVQQWLLQAGESEIALSVSVRMEAPQEELRVLAVPAAGEARPQDRSQDVVESAVVEATSEARFPAKTAMPTGEATGKNTSPKDTSPARLQEGAKAGAPRQRLDLLLDIELEATLRFGALELPLREVLELGPGDVLPLDRHVREPVDLVVGDRIVARGEVVLVDGNFGLHVTEVAEPRSRLETIRCLF